MKYTFIYDLKPCPFCGGEAVLDYYISTYVYCKRCGIEGKHFDTFEVESAAKKAIEAWNRRAYEQGAREKGEWRAEHEHAYIGDSCKEWDNFYCSLCDALCNAPYSYCPNCGAKMDEISK